jgi:hypothetical protein
MPPPECGQLPAQDKKIVEKIPRERFDGSDVALSEFISRDRPPPQQQPQPRK